MADEDVLSLTEARAAVYNNASTPGTLHDAAIGTMVTAISVRMDELVGPIVQRDITEYHDGGDSSIIPRQTPVASIGTLTEADGTDTTVLAAESFGTIPSDGYLLAQNDQYPHDCVIWRRDQGYDARFPTGRQNVELVYTAGRAADTASVAARYKQTAKAIITRMWEREAGAWARPVDPFDPETQGSTRFFNAVRFVIEEQLRDELKPPGVG